MWKQQNPQQHQQVHYEEPEEEESESGSEGETETDSESETTDPSYSVIEEETWRKLSNISLQKKPISRDEKSLVDVNETSFEQVHKLIQDGLVESLKVDQCKVYLRKNGLRLTGKKETLIQRIREHQEILNGGGEKKYPASSFVLNCKGDACTGDVVMFEQNVYEMYNIASRSASGPPRGTRVVAGRIVKENYGASKQQHTFTIEVLWSKGEKPLPTLHPLLIKGRNLYRLKTMRQRWENEGERLKVLLDKHSRGFVARSARETRIQEKEERKLLKEKRALEKEQKRNQPQPDSALEGNRRNQVEKMGLAVNKYNPADQQHQTALSFQPQDKTERRVVKSGLCIDLQKPRTEAEGSGILPAEVNIANSVQPGIKIQDCGIINDGWKMGNRPQPSGFAANSRKLPLQFKVQNMQRVGNSCSQFVPGASFDCGTRWSNFNAPPGPPCRLPWTGTNHFRPMSQSHAQGNEQQRVCRYYVQGSCKFGDSCKFLHLSGCGHGEQCKEDGQHYYPRRLPR